MCTTIIFFTPPKEQAMGRKALHSRLCFIFCFGSLARQNHFTGTTVWFNCSWKETETKSLSYTTKQHCSLFSVTAHKEKAFLPMVDTESIYPLPTDVDTVCCGLSCCCCPLKTIVSLLSSLLLSFSSLFLTEDRRQRGAKMVKGLRMASCTPGVLSTQRDLAEGLYCG